MSESQESPTPSDHEGQHPQVGSYWAYTHQPQPCSDDTTTIRALIRVQRWYEYENGASSVDLCCSEARATGLEPGQVEQICQHETDLHQLDFPKFWKLVDTGRLALIDTIPHRSHYPHRPELTSA